MDKAQSAGEVADGTTAVVRMAIGTAIFRRVIKVRQPSYCKYIVFICNSTERRCHLTRRSSMPPPMRLKLTEKIREGPPAVRNIFGYMGFSL